MNRKQNTSYLLRQWIVPGVAILLAALFAGSQLLQGNLLPVAIVAALVALVVAWTYYGGAREETRLLQAATAEPLLAYYDRRFAQAMIADRDAALAFSKALALTVYGRFTEARAVLAPIQWTARPPMVAAQATLAQAWSAYLSKPDGAAGLALAQQARQMADVPGALPGGGQSLAVYDAAVEMGQVLTGSGGPEAAQRLEARLPRQPRLPRILLAWGLRNYAERAGETAMAGRMREWLAKTAPHCAGLTKRDHE